MLAHELALFPQRPALRGDQAFGLRTYLDMPLDEALANELRHGTVFFEGGCRRRCKRSRSAPEDTVSLNPTNRLERSNNRPYSHVHPVKDRIIVALDVPDRAGALRLVEQLSGLVGMFKIGSQLFAAEGPSLVPAK